MAKKGYLLEMFLLLVDKEEGAALLNLVIADTMNVSVSAMTLLTEILNKCEKFNVYLESGAGIKVLLTDKETVCALQSLYYIISSSYSLVPRPFLKWVEYNFSHK